MRTTDTLPFAVQITADRKYLNVRIPVSHLPAELLDCPSAINVRLVPETAEVRARSRTGQRWSPDYLLSLRA